MLGTGQTFVTGRKPSSYVLVGNLRKPHSPLLDLLEYLGKTQYVYIVLVISSFSYFYRFSNLFIYVYIYIYIRNFVSSSKMHAADLGSVFFAAPSRRVVTDRSSADEWLMWSQKGGYITVMCSYSGLQMFC